MSLKVLHVLSALGQGGIEKWLVDVTPEMQRLYGTEVQIEFLTFFSSGGYYQSRLEEMGCRVGHCQLVWMRLPSFVLRLAAHLRQGRYDVVHCHADYLSGLILPVAHMVGARTRICHVHNTHLPFQERRPVLRHLAGRLLRRLSVCDGGFCLGCSPAAIDSYLAGLKHKMRNRFYACGIPCENYRTAVNMEKRNLRQSLKWPDRSKVVLHVGRHSEQKNLFYLMEIFARILRRDGNALFVQAGSGLLTPALQDKARELGISERVRFLGSRDDVPQLMRAADIFLFPSLYEGLGLVLIEAQAVGLRSLISDVIPPEVEVVKGLVHRLPLTEPAEKWADRAQQLMELPLPDAQESLNLVEASPFSITNSARALMALYIEQNKGL
jgi:glycosyltransferase involved in cell wall biosynthesis